MKKLVLLSIFTIYSLFAAGISKDEAQVAKQIMQEAMQIQSGNKGESIFMSKDSTKNDFTNSSIRIEPTAQQPQGNAYQQVSYDAVAQSGELTEEQLALLKSAARNKNLRALQNKFFNKKYKGTENSITLVYQENMTQKIRTRFAMATTIIFESNIDSYMLGDNTGFKVEQLPNLSNALAVKPLLIGIDTSLTVFTKDKKMHLFYLFSTDYKSNQNPYLVVKIKNEPDPESLDEAILGKKQAQKKKDDEYLIIKEGIAEIKIKKSEIYDKYVQKSLEKNQWLLAEEIFNDKQFTYFKYDKNKLPQIPTVFTVVDKQDSPMETRVIGDYLIAETTAEKFTLKIGESYVCVERLTPDNADKYLTKKEISEGKKKKIEKSHPKITPKTKTKIIDSYRDECEMSPFMSASEWIESDCVGKGKNLFDNKFFDTEKVRKKSL